MKKPSPSTERKQLENELFTQIYNATMECFGLSSASYPCSKGLRQRWIDVANIWSSAVGISQNAICTSKSHSVLDHALHMIYNGTPFTSLSANYKNLVELVVKALLTCEAAFEALRRHDLFRSAFGRVCSLFYDGNRSSTRRKTKYALHRTFLKYQVDHFYYRLFYRSKKAPTLNLETADWREVRKAKTHADIRASCIAYEVAISFLLPEAEKWSDKQWLNKNTLFHALQKHYGKNWETDPDGLDYLILALMEMKYYGRPLYRRYFLLVKDMPGSLIKHIWPENTDECLQDLFTKAVTQIKIGETKLKRNLICRPAYTNKLLRESWLYAEMIKNSASLPKEFQKIVFTFSVAA